MEKGLIFTPSELNALINEILNEHFNDFEGIQVEGEVTNLSVSSSGHVYFSLKDRLGGIFPAVCWKSSFFQKDSIMREQVLSFLVTGSELVCQGKLKNYNGKIQLVVSKIENIQSEGALFLAFEKTKKELIALGYFDAKHKKPLPKIPKKICLVTSPTGSVLQDMLHRIKERFPLEVLLVSIAVQGKNAYWEALRAIQRINSEQKNIDLIILARGGGSFEELSPFNNVKLVEAIFRSKIPVVSAIGHETDFTLSDFVADLRAPTPSSAIEMALPLLSDFFEQIERASVKIHQNVNYKFQKIYENFKLIRKNLFKDFLNLKISKCKMQMNFSMNQIQLKITKKLDDTNSKTKYLMAYFEKFNHKYILMRGYSICWKEEGGGGLILNEKNKFNENLKSRNKPNLKIEFYDGFSDLL